MAQQKQANQWYLTGDSSKVSDAFARIIGEVIPGSPAHERTAPPPGRCDYPEERGPAQQIYDEARRLRRNRGR